VIGGTKKKPTPFWTPELKTAVKIKNQAFRLWMKIRTKETREEYVKQRNLVNSTRHTAKQECWEKLGKYLEEDLQGNKKLLYNLAKSYRQGDKESATAVKDQDGNLLVGQEDISQRWTQYFSTVLNVPENLPSSTDNENMMQEDTVAGDEEDVISFEEVQKAEEHMKNNKSPGFDGLPAEIFKKGGDAMITWLQDIFNSAWKQGRIPEDWGKAVICPVSRGHY